MRYWFRGKRGGLIAFILIAALVAGGLGWMTAAVLRLEREQLEAQVRGAQDEQLRVEMWKLEARVAPRWRWKTTGRSTTTVPSLPHLGRSFAMTANGSRTRSLSRHR